MGALVEVLSKRDDDTIPLVITMLQELVHRGNQRHGIITPVAAFSAQSIADLTKQRSTSSTVAIGRNLSSCKETESLNAQTGRMILEGRILCKSPDLDLSQTAAGKEKSLEEIGKRILRQLAKSLGIPVFIADRPKKAIQYDTGVDEALRDLARTKGLTLREYTKQVFSLVYPTLEGRQSEHSNLLQPDIS